MSALAIRGLAFERCYQPFFLIVAGLAVIGIIVAFVLLKPPVKRSA